MHHHSLVAGPLFVLLCCLCRCLVLPFVCRPHLCRVFLLAFRSLLLLLICRQRQRARVEFRGRIPHLRVDLSQQTSLHVSSPFLVWTLPTSHYQSLFFCWLPPSLLLSHTSIHPLACLLSLICLSPLASDKKTFAHCARALWILPPALFLSACPPSQEEGINPLVRILPNNQEVLVDRTPFFSWQRRASLWRNNNRELFALHTLHSSPTSFPLVTLWYSVFLPALRLPFFEWERE